MRLSLCITPPPLNKAGGGQDVAFTFLRRLVLVIPVMVGVLVITFIIMRIVPMDPVYLVLGPEDMADPAAVERVRQDMGLDDPLPVEFVRYVADIARGDLGRSHTTHQLVVDDLVQRFPATFELTTIALALTVVLGIPLGVISAVNKDRFLDHASRLFSLFGVAMPGFWLGIVLVFIFYYRLGVLPPPMGQLEINLRVERITGIILFDVGPTS